MARPISKGVDYFPLDVGFMNNLKIRKVIQACGPNSIAIIMLLLGNIYGDEGYYMRWDEDVCFLITEALGVKDLYALETVKKCLQVDLFDENLFNKYKILTSRGIQKRYFEITKRRKNNDIIQDFLLINVAEINSNIVNVAETRVNVAETRVNVNNNSVIAYKSTQRKEKESKVNKKQTHNMFKVCINKYTNNPKLINCLCVFVDLRINKNRPFVDEASFELFLKQLDEYSKGCDDVKISLLETSIMNGWINIYPVKYNSGFNFDTKRQTDGMSEDELKEMLGYVP